MEDFDLISIIIPVYNCVDFIEECFKSIEFQDLDYLDIKESKIDSECSGRRDTQDKLDLSPAQNCKRKKLHLEISIFEDGSTDGTAEIVDKWVETFQNRERRSAVISKNNSGSPKGVGYARNRAIEQSSGEYLCFLDADDIMERSRIAVQYLVAKDDQKALIGSKFKRIPEGSTENFTFWANNLTESQLQTQIYLTFGPSILMPTWFCHRKVYENISGGFDESGKGTPEDLIFFYKHFDGGGTVKRTDESLMIYRYHPSATTFTVSDATIWNIRLERLESVVLSQWDKFTIWNAGKSGRRFYRSLKESNRNKVIALCDVDQKKLNQKSYHPYPLKIQIPIVHPKDASPPFIICVKTDLIWDENGDFRKLLDSLNITEGKDFFYFN